MHKILRVDMSTLRAEWEKVSDDYGTLGERGLTSRIVFDAVKPSCDPLGPFNKLVLAPGLLGGTSVPCSGRLSVGSKSPLTGGIKESNSGGVAAIKLARLGLKAVIIEETPPNEDIYVLKITKDDWELTHCRELMGLSTTEIAQRLQEVHGSAVAVILIGPAGELKLPSAVIATTDMEGNPSRFSARGGLGAVMGSKGLKAIVLDDTGTERPKVKDTNLFRKALRKFNKLIRETPQTAEIYPLYSTAAMVSACNGYGALPTRNFSQGEFEKAEEISGERMYDLILERAGEGTTTHACMPGCTVKCSNKYPNKQGKVVVGPLEYETIVLMGSNLGIGDLDQIARLNRLCNEIGLDTIEMGGVLGVAAEAGLWEFGDAERAAQLLSEIGEGTVLGKLLGSGAYITGQVLGVRRIPTVKGQGMSGFDPRGIKGTGCTYATSPMGADHTAGHTIRANVDHLSPEGQAQLSRKTQIMITGFDNAGLCMMTVPALSKDTSIVADLISARYGLNLGKDFLTQSGREILKAERAFNHAAGFGPAHNRLPEFFYHEKLPPHGSVFDVKDEELEALLEF